MPLGIKRINFYCNFITWRYSIPYKTCGGFWDKIWYLYRNTPLCQRSTHTKMLVLSLHHGPDMRHSHMSCTLTIHDLSKFLWMFKFSEWLPMEFLRVLFGPLLYADVRHVIRHSSIKSYKWCRCLAMMIVLEIYQAFITGLCMKWHDGILNWILRSVKLFSNKRSPILFEYCIGSHPILWSQKVKYLGVIINLKFNWNDHCQYVCGQESCSCSMVPLHNLW